MDNPPVTVKNIHGAFQVERFVMDWNNDVLKVVEIVGPSGSYTIISREVVASDIWALMPSYE
ncbi:MAG: hypothetical protein U1F77_15555 [Kiritimatiellia bacterium]